MQSGKVFRLWEIFVSKPSAGKKKKSAKTSEDFEQTQVVIDLLLTPLLTTIKNKRSYFVLKGC